MTGSFVVAQQLIEASLRTFRASFKNKQLCSPGRSKNQVSQLRSRIKRVEDQYESSLFTLVKETLAGTVRRGNLESDVAEQLDADISTALKLDLPTRLKRRLRSPKDELAEDLVFEAKSLHEYLSGPETGVAWTPQLGNPTESRRIIEQLEEKTRLLQMSIAVVVLHDDQSEYTEAVLRSMKILAKTAEAPPGCRYSDVGRALRYYPLMLLLYTIFICGVARRRTDLLRHVAALPLRHSEPGYISDITDSFFYSHHAHLLFNDMLERKLCEPIAARIQQAVDEYIGEEFAELSRDEYYFQGEFALALVRIDHMLSGGAHRERVVPVPGLYLYSHKADQSVSVLLAENHEWLAGLYSTPLRDILDHFDRNAVSVVSPNCFATGLTSGTVGLYDRVVPAQ